MRLGDQFEAMAYDIAFWLSAFTNPDYPLEDLGEVCVNVCAKLRAAAIVSLLARSDAVAYAHNLVRSGRCRASYLQRIRASGRAQYHGASGRVSPFYDAVAAGDFSLARQIAALSPREWQQGQEYEDDWCQAQIAHSILQPLVDSTHVQGLLLRWERVLDGEDEPRLPVLRALAQRDAGAFDGAFEGLLTHREEAIAAERARARIEEPVMLASREVFVDGLAFLRMATQLGLPTQHEYRGCPSMARQTLQTALPPEW